MGARKCSALVLIIVLGLCGYSLAQDASQIQRSEEIMEQERALREKLEEEKIFAKEIEVEGVTLLSEEEVIEVISPFQEHWLTKKDIQRMLGSIKKAYTRKGYAGEQLAVSYRVKNNTRLVVSIQESGLKRR